MEYVLDFIFCFSATFCFSFIMSVPKRIIIHASVISGASFLLYDLVKSLGVSETFAIFIGTATVALCGEVLARIMKFPATIFVLPGVIPFVPGLGIYRTMLALIQKDLGKMQTEGIQTILTTLAMAMAIACINVIARNFFTFLKIKKK